MTILRLASSAEAPDTKPANIWWMAQCECGKVKPIRGCNISEYRKKNLGCGCRAYLTQGGFADPAYRGKHGFKRPLGQPGMLRTRKGDSAKLIAFRSYKAGAARRGYTWAISFDDFLRLTSSPCHYCGELWSVETGRNTKINGTYKRNGIDRQDNNIGYVLDNCVPCCWPCNGLKKAQDETEWLSEVIQTAAHLMRIAAHQETQSRSSQFVNREMTHERAID